jgi:ABC-type transport system involved in cytochrome c biogenesis permease subunit
MIYLAFYNTTRADMLNLWGKLLNALFLSGKVKSHFRLITSRDIIIFVNFFETGVYKYFRDFSQKGTAGGY